MLRDNQQFNESIKSNSAFLDELRQKMPEFFTASKYDEQGNLVESSTFDNEKFQQALKEHNIDELSSGYRLDFIGKNYAKKQAGERPTTVIVPDNDHNQKEDNINSKNLFFTGDNLEVLRHLQQNYANSVDFIYIDPPYNTGSDGFVYPDKFEYSDDQLKDMFAINDDELKRLKSIQGKATHSAWLTFMYPRLYLAKKVLKDTGVIFVSIDDNEQANLKLLMDEVFGEVGFRNTILVRRRSKSLNLQFADNGLQTFNVGAEYMLVYAKSEKALFNPIEKKKSFIKEKGTWNVFWSNADRPTMRYELLGFTPTTGQWRWAKDKALEGVKNYKEYLEKYLGKYTLEEYSKKNPRKKFVRRIENGTGKNGGVQYYVAPSNTSLRTSNWTDLEVSQIAKQYEIPFDNPKNIELIKEVVRSKTDKYSLVLDFFAGSSTTADAVMQLNAEDGGNRQYIMCTLPEPTFTVNSDGKEVPTKGGEAAYKAGYRSIDEISRERIIRAARKIKEENPLLTESQDFGFKHYRVVSPTQDTLDKIEYADNLQLDLFDDMIDAFSSEKLGVAGNADGFDTILHTYLAKDNYQFDVPLQMKDFAGIQLPYVNNQRIYLIANNWQAENTRALVNAIGKNELVVQTIVVYGYTLGMESLRELEIALNQLENKVNLQVRY
ncbi:MAG: DNA methyltransferase [Streptococcus suis]